MKAWKNCYTESSLSSLVMWSKGEAIKSVLLRLESSAMASIISFMI